MTNSGLIIFIILILIIIPANRRRKYNINRIKRKGRKNMLPKEMIKEFIGKVCYVHVFDASVTSYVRILDVEDNWLKVRNYRGVVSMINGDMVKSIEVTAEKYQSKCQ